MKKPNDDVQTIVLSQPLDYVVDDNDQDYERARVFGPLGLIVNLIYAVFFVGIVGYYLDKLFHTSR